MSEISCDGGSGASPSPIARPCCSAGGGSAVNFRLSQLTYAEDHPGEELPAFHFVVEVTEDK